MNESEDFEVGFFVHAGNQTAHDIFKPFLRNERGIEKALRKHLAKSYGDGLNLILVRFYVEGGPPEDLPGPRVTPYRVKELAVGTEIPVIRSAFHDKGDAARAQFVGESVAWSTSQVRKKLERKLTSFDFLALEQDIANAVREYVDLWK